MWLSPIRHGRIGTVLLGVVRNGKDRLGRLGSERSSLDGCSYALSGTVGIGMAGME